MRRIIALLLLIIITISFVSCKKDTVPPSTAEAPTKEYQRWIIFTY